MNEKVIAAVRHYDEARQRKEDTLRVAGIDSGEYLRADQVAHVARVLLDAALREAHEYDGGPKPGEVTNAQSGIFAEIALERDRQDGQWGESEYCPDVWALLISKHAGRLSADALSYLAAPGYADQYPTVMDARRRAIIVAAVSVAFVECIDRQAWPTP